METISINKKKSKRFLLFISKLAQMIYAKMVEQRRYCTLSFHDCFLVLVSLLCLVVLSYFGSCNLMFIMLVIDMLVGYL